MTIDKERILSKAIDFKLGKWNPSAFDDLILDKAEDEDKMFGFDVKLKRRMAYIHAHGRKPIENSIDGDDDIERVNEIVRNCYEEGLKNVRLEYGVIYVNMTAIMTSKRKGSEMRDNGDTGAKKKAKVRMSYQNKID